MAATKRAWKLQEFVAHAPSVNCVALGHKSGRVMATGGEDKKVNMWAVGKPNCIMSLSGHTSPVEAVRFGNAEEIVAAGSLSGAIKIWDLEQAKILRTLTGHKSNVKCLDFHPYGEFVASGATDSNVKLWDIRRKGCIFTYKGHSNCVNALRFSPDGRWIASASDDSLVKIWDITAGRLLADLKQHTGSVTCVEFHPNEFLLASGSSDRTVKFWDLEKLACVDSTDGDCAPIRCISFHPDGGCVFAASQDVLKVYGWEPTRCHDSVVPGWGKLSDMTVAQAQLIGVSFNQSNTATYVVDLTKVAPIGSAPGPPAPPMTGSGRRNFLTERPPTQSTKQQPPHKKLDQTATSCESGAAKPAVVTGTERPRAGSVPGAQDTLRRPGSGVASAESRAQDPAAAAAPAAARTVQRHGSVSGAHPVGASSSGPDQAPGKVGYTGSGTLDRRKKTAARPSDEPAAAAQVPPAARPAGSHPLSPCREKVPGAKAGCGSSSSADTGSAEPPTDDSDDVLTSMDTRASAAASAHVDRMGTAARHARGSAKMAPAGRPYPSQVDPAAAGRPLQEQETLTACSPIAANGGLSWDLLPEGAAVGERLNNVAVISRARNGSHGGTGLDNGDGGSLAPDNVPVRDSTRWNPGGRFANGVVSSKPAEEPDDAQPIPNAGNQEDAGDDLSSVADVKDPQEYREIFQPRSRLAASPAVPGPTKKAEPFPAPADDGYGASPGSAAGPASSAAAGDYLAKVAPPAGPMPPQGRAAQQTAAAPDEEETLAGMNRGHDAMISALAKRNKHLQIVRAMWSSGNIKSAIDSAIHMKDDSVIVDLLNVLNLKPTSWDLDVCAILLPRLSDLLATKYESYIQVACAALRLILKNFAPIIKQNMNSPPSIGIDISREERHRKCKGCYKSLMDIRLQLETKQQQTYGGKLAGTFRELQLLINNLD